MATLSHNATILSPPVSAPTLHPLPGAPSVCAVVAATAAHFGVTVEALTADTRKHPTVRQRQLAMWIARRVTRRSMIFIAEKLGRKDHTTVLCACRDVDSWIAAGDADTIAAINGIAARLTGVAQ
jgi:chromosomal replication initiation ATPase DnaA